MSNVTIHYCKNGKGLCRAFLYPTETFQEQLFSDPKPTPYGNVVISCDHPNHLCLNKCKHLEVRTLKPKPIYKPKPINEDEKMLKMWVVADICQSLNIATDLAQEIKDSVRNKLNKKYKKS